MENMVLTTITNGELTEVQSEKVKAITDKFGKSFEGVASVCIRYNDILEKSEVAFCEYAHTALELLKKSKVPAKNKVFAEMTGIRTDKITKCDKVYTEVIANISANLVERCGYNSRNELLTDYSFSQLYVMKRVKNKFAFELMFLEHINNYTVSEITFLTDMEDMRLMNGDEIAIEEFFNRRKIFIGQNLKIDEFDKYEFDEKTNCYIAKTETETETETKTETETETETETKTETKTETETETKTETAKTLDINTILDYIRQCESIDDVKAIKAVCATRIKELSK